MENLFDRITKKLPKATPQMQQELANTYKDPAADTSKATDLSTKDLVARWQATNNEADTAELLKRMQPTISSAITSFGGGDQSLDVKAAKLTIDALKTYDPTMGADPTTHVFHNLKRLNRYSAQRNDIIPRSEYSVLEQKNLQRYIDTFTEEKGREPSIGELADISGLSTKKVEKLLDNQVRVINDTSTLTDESMASTIGSKDVTDEDYFEYVYASVGPIDQKIMEWASGFHKKPILSNGEIAKKLGVSQAAVSQRKARIQKMLSDVRGLV